MVSARVILRINESEFQKLLVDAEKITNEAADYMAEEMKKSISSGAKSGRKYGNHTSSAPGQSPANWTGELIRSIKVQKDKNKSFVYVTAKYAEFLEFGTSKMRPRPFIIPSFIKTKKWFSNKLHRLAYGGRK